MGVRDRCALFLELSEGLHEALAAAFVQGKPLHVQFDCVCGVSASQRGSGVTRICAWMKPCVCAAGHRKPTVRGLHTPSKFGRCIMVLCRVCTHAPMHPPVHALRIHASGNACIRASTSYHPSMFASQPPSATSTQQPMASHPSTSLACMPTPQLPHCTPASHLRTPASEHAHAR